MNINGTSIKIDMPTSQYGTLDINGKLYNVHVTKLYSTCLGINPPCYSFVLSLMGEDAVEPEETWADSYEAI